MVDLPATLEVNDEPVLFGRYRLRKLLGSGGMARVYLTQKLRGTEPYFIRALKVVLPPRSLAGTDAALLRQYLAQESQVAGHLNSDHIVKVSDFVEIEGLSCIEMEYVDGVGLDRLLAQEIRLDTDVAIEIAAQICSALYAAHSLHLGGRFANLVHRDIKPANVLLSREGQVKLTDFGIAKAASVFAKLTLDGEIRGTPAYMSPEQVRGDELDKRSDIFSLGSVLYQMLVGSPPFVGPSVTATIAQILVINTRLSSIREEVDGVAPGLGAVVQRCLYGEAGPRYSDASKLRTDLLRCSRRSVDRQELADMVNRVSDAQVELTNYPITEGASDDADDGTDDIVPPDGGEAGGAGGTPDDVDDGRGVGKLPGRTGAHAPHQPEDKTRPFLPMGEEVEEVPPVPPASRPTQRGILAGALALGAALGILVMVGVLALWDRGVVNPPQLTTPTPELPEPAPPENMVAIPAGAYGIGCLPGDLTCDDDERPRVRVSLEPFFIDRLEVTVGAYRDCVEGGDCTEPGDSDPDGSERCNWDRDDAHSHPINCVDWTQASHYCTSIGKRLPREVEWEAAARQPCSDDRCVAGQTPNPWGTSPAHCGVAHIQDADGMGCGTELTSSVGDYPAGEAESHALDLGGNVEEWVQDPYSRTALRQLQSWQAARPGRGPGEFQPGNVVGKERVLRGGSLVSVHTGKGLRSSFRHHAEASRSHYAWGFRCAMDSSTGSTDAEQSAEP